MRRECAVVVDGQLGNNSPVCMTGSQNLRRDLCRVNFEVNNLKPFSHLAFPQMRHLENTSKELGFDGELMASFTAVPSRPLVRMGFIENCSGLVPKLLISATVREFQ